MNWTFPVQGLLATTSVVLVALPAPPVFSGDVEADLRLHEHMASAMDATKDYGAWPDGRWEIHLHVDGPSFEQATHSTPARAAQWVGRTLHLRPWEQLQRRDLDAILRHELVHRRLQHAGLRRWEEEARCIHAQSHVHPPSRWTESPTRGMQDRLDRALQSGTTKEQAWAYGALSAWVRGKGIPNPPLKTQPKHEEAWRKEALETSETVTVRWPEDRLPRAMVVNGQTLSNRQGKPWRFTGRVSFGPEMPVRALEGTVTLEWRARSHGGTWSLAWQTTPSLWMACAVAGEIGDDAPFEARRALAAVLKVWLEGHPKGHHLDGSLCPLTHCSVVRGMASESTQQAAATAPALNLDPRWALFTSSKGGVSLSIRQIWGEGPDGICAVPKVPGDRWADWERSLDARQVQTLKRLLRVGLRPGQKGIRLGASGPYPVEDLRLNAGRAFGWPCWPSNACEVTPLEDGGIRIQGHGWGHNAGLCLAAAAMRAQEGWKAEAILEEAFGVGVLK